MGKSSIFKKTSTISAVVTIGVGGFFFNPALFSAAHADVQVVSENVPVDSGKTLEEGVRAESLVIDGIDVSKTKMTYEVINYLSKKSPVPVEITMVNDSPEDTYLYTYEEGMYPGIPEKVELKSGQKVKLIAEIDYSDAMYEDNAYGLTGFDFYFGDENGMTEGGYFIDYMGIEGEYSKYGPEDRDYNGYNTENEYKNLFGDGMTYYKNQDRDPIDDGLIIKDTGDERDSSLGGYLSNLRIKKAEDGSIVTADGKTSAEYDLILNDGFDDAKMISEKTDRFYVDPDKAKEIGSDYVGTYVIPQEELKKIYDGMVQSKVSSGTWQNIMNISYENYADYSLLFIVRDENDSESALLSIGFMPIKIAIYNSDLPNEGGFFGIDTQRRGKISYSTTPPSPKVGMKAYIDDKTPEDPSALTKDGQSSDANDLTPNLDRGTYKVSYDFKNTGLTPITNVVLKDGDGNIVKDYGDRIFEPQEREVFVTDVTVSKTFKKNLTIEAKSTLNDETSSSEDPISANVEEDSRMPSATEDSVKTDFETPVIITPLENDTLVDNGSEWKSVDLINENGEPVKSLETDEGTFVVNEDNTVTFTPKEGFSGDVPAVKYRATDSDDKIADSTISVTVGEKETVEEETPPVDEEDNGSTDEPSEENPDVTEEQPKDETSNGEQPEENPEGEQPEQENSDSPSDSESPDEEDNGTTEGSDENPDVIREEDNSTDKSGSDSDDYNSNKLTDETPIVESPDRNNGSSDRDDSVETSRSSETQSSSNGTNSSESKDNGSNFNDPIEVKTGGEAVSNSNHGFMIALVSSMIAFVVSGVSFFVRRGMKKRNSEQ